MILKTVIKIDEEILKKVNCKKNLSCLSGTDICKVELCIDGKIHFIKCINLEPCHHRISFGYSFICKCPVRKELFNKYKI
ncbi:hypothetical protein METP2_02955 [Methanosarcinales archaeon]|uniref:hypothetical protein n=1 Tax=Candidatus Methanoperedens sp. BLZ2 TaxID=2035255 RepID=UPI00114152AE|nr:hypothetical protein [Candidatus Methanoperedens sp. BLZ2]KAB2946474.1 MAG: hypothetical protein F9K14_07790 [Candidatus Methanoperedens sp.]MBZ0175713.1 hypothetical protein [Candidatus Methanoperedens nitroreducens]CAG0996542.1 hypothetical protein METP2_02955 [Methanosarcinales archaeon]MCX9089023.1 hypothetical protein [Candidatus Methanoperedens sp.]WAH95018.1 MAG: hypothetical protein OI863_00035 [Candidatus Methanoperedens sp.]